MKIVEVSTRQHQRDFLEVARVLYQGDTNFVCPLDTDIEAVFDPKRNSFHTHGEATRFVAYGKDGDLIGRIAVFINKNKAYKFLVPTGGVGFFESINDELVSSTLFETAERWLKERGMKAYQGPINFGENDTFWGLLVEGFSRPSYGMNYHLPHYKQLFENYGFKVSYEQISNSVPKTAGLPERFKKVAQWVLGKEGYEVRHFEKSKIETYVADLIEIYNDGWRDFQNFTPLEKTIVMESFEKMKIIADEKLIWYAYVDGEPAAFVVTIPDINPMIKTLNGKLNWWGKLVFMYHKIFVGTDRIRAVVMGTKKKFQKHGLEAALFYRLNDAFVSNEKYQECEISWVGDFNGPMQAVQQALQAQFERKHITYEKAISV